MKHSQIEFDPVKHQYSFKGVPYLSATQAVGRVANEFDTEMQAALMAERHGQDSTYWKRKWKGITDHAISEGNKLHDQKESQLLATQMQVQRGKVIPVRNPQIQLNIMGMENMYYWPDGIYPELLLYNHQYHLAGRADKVRLVTYRSGRRWAFIEDYKTNKAIKKTPWYDKETGYRKLKSPLSHLNDCSHALYSLQLSIYQFMLEEIGFQVGTRTLLHYPVLPTGLESYPGERVKKPIKYKLDYLREEVIALLNSIQHEQGTKGLTDM